MRAMGSDQVGFILLSMGVYDGGFVCKIDSHSNKGSHPTFSLLTLMRWMELSKLK
jgi:hypothetical protein